MIRFKTGDILEEDAEAWVDKVNRVGVMGRGIVLRFKKGFRRISTPVSMPATGAMSGPDACSCSTPGNRPVPATSSISRPSGTGEDKAESRMSKED